MLYNTPEMDKGGTDDNGTAAILEGTQLCCTCQLRDILHCLGGVSVLLPLVNQLGRANPPSPTPPSPPWAGPKEVRTSWKEDAVCGAPAILWKSFS